MSVAPIVPLKFTNPDVTADGQRRASVALSRLDTLWINTGTLCNIACANCYIESSPKNDALAYISAAEVAGYLDELQRDGWPTLEIGFTGGEPFLNKDLLAMVEDALGRGFQVLILTNAMRPMHLHKDGLLDLRRRFADRLRLRVSIDHFDPEIHEQERGKGTWAPMEQGLVWLAEHGFWLAAAGRVGFEPQGEAALRQGFQDLIDRLGVPLDSTDPERLVLFPEMDPGAEVPEITEACWGLLHKDPNDVMCATSRMVVKRKGADAPAVLSCTLLAYDRQFELGRTLDDAKGPVKLNHPHCAKFCVLGGASCSRG